MNQNRQSGAEPESGILDRFVSREYAVPLICICLLVSALFAGFNHSRQIHLLDIVWLFGVTVAIEFLYLWLVPEPSTWLTKALRVRGLLGQTAAAALASIAIALGLLVSLLRTFPEGEYYSTDLGVHRLIGLADGSTADLNTQSRLKVTYTRSVRSVELLQGEAAFAVVHDAHRPFEVKAAGAVVQAVGTTFGVRLRSDSIVDITVETGAVALDLRDDVKCSLPRRDKSHFLLAANIEVRITRSDCFVSPVSPDATRRNFAWKHDQLWLGGATLQEAADEFNRYNRLQLQVDPIIATTRVGGVFRVTDVDSFVDSMEIAGVAQAVRREAEPGSPQSPTIRLVARQKTDNSR